MSESVEPLAVIVQVMEREHGFNIAPYDSSFLRQAVGKRLDVTGLPTLEAYRDHLVRQRDEAMALFRSLNIGYSGFFRNPLSFALLEQLVLPSLVAEKERSGCGEIRVWSAGCAAGQEAWSAAMLLDGLAASRVPPVPYRIFATDLSEEGLSQARAGVYSAEAVAAVQAGRLLAFFSRQGEAFSVVSRLRDRVDFSRYDLLDDRLGSPAASIYGDFDLIFCCNLLFYYRPDIQQRILSKICGALSAGGYLVTGEAEREAVARQKGLRAVAAPAAVFHKRGMK